MRLGLLLVSVAAIAACAPTAPPMQRTAEAHAHLDRLLAGRVAGPPQNCVNTFSARDMITIDDNTVVFKSGSTYYRNDFRGEGCSQLSRPGAALITKNFSGSQLCTGEIAEVKDTANGTFLGACSFGEFVPYRKV